jgi:transposase
MARREELTEEQWPIIQPLIPTPPSRADGHGRPWRDAREVLNGILWILRSGARWQDLRGCFPPDQTCHRRFQQWVRGARCGASLRPWRQTCESAANSI